MAADNQRSDPAQTYRNAGVVRIPPPPLLPHERNHENNRQPQQGAPFPWILRARYQNRNGGFSVVRIHVNPSMTNQMLGQCISQAVASCNAMPPVEHIVGLFAEHDSIFYSLQHILSAPNIDTSERTMWSVHRPIIREEPKDEFSWMVILEYLLFAAVLATSAYYYGEDVWDSSTRILLDFFYRIFDLPIRELYRHGPYLIGWENLDLPTICSRITYHGDRSFWSRNIEECEAIFHAKEEAFVRICRPIMYVFFAIITFMVVRHLVSVYAESKRDRTDRVVLETYHAFQNMIGLITRQVDRQTGGRRRH